jgi:hypothetical protein
MLESFWVSQVLTNRLEEKAHSLWLIGSMLVD